MKCPHCGAQIGLEEKYCPFCGLPNEFARKHQEDMDRYEQEFQHQGCFPDSSSSCASALPNPVMLLIIIVFSP